jgi:hypothetical protein
LEVDVQNNLDIETLGKDFETLDKPTQEYLLKYAGQKMKKRR